jgi:hypothetical protein
VEVNVLPVSTEAAIIGSLAPVGGGVKGFRRLVVMVENQSQ